MRMHKHLKSHERANISSIKTQQSLHTGSRDRDKQTALWRRSAVRHKAGSKKTARQEGDNGFRHKMRRKGDRERGQGRDPASKTNRIYKPASSCGLCPRAVCVCVCRRSYYKVTRGELYAWCHLNTVVWHVLLSLALSVRIRKKVECILITSSPLAGSQICNMITQTPS